MKVRSKATRRAAKPEQSAEENSGGVPTSRQVQRPTRRPMAIVVAIVLAIVGAVGAYVGLSQRGEVQALTTKTTVLRGDTLSTDSFSTISVAKDTSNVLTTQEIEQMVGKKATVDLPAGSLVMRENTAENLSVDEGEAIVGIGVSSVATPGRQLVAGDNVRIVFAPTDQATGANVASIRGVVQQTRDENQEGMTVVDVSVASDQAEAAARWSASGNAALVLDGDEAATTTKAPERTAPKDGAKP